jgi:hypothetical protein
MLPNFKWILEILKLRARWRKRAKPSSKIKFLASCSSTLISSCVSKPIHSIPFPSQYTVEGFMWSYMWSYTGDFTLFIFFSYIFFFISLFYTHFFIFLFFSSFFICSPWTLNCIVPTSTPCLYVCSSSGYIYIYIYIPLFGTLALYLPPPPCLYVCSSSAIWYPGYWITIQHPRPCHARSGCLSPIFLFSTSRRFFYFPGALSGLMVFFSGGLSRTCQMDLGPFFSRKITRKRTT